MTAQRFLAVWTIPALSSVLLWSGCNRSPSPPVLGTERVIATVATNKEAELHFIEVSPDGEQAAVIYNGRLNLTAEQKARMDTALDRWLSGQGGYGLLMRELDQVHQESWAVVDGQSQNPVYSIWTTQFSPDGRRFGYIVFNRGRDVQKLRNGTSSRTRYDTYVVVNGEPQGKIYSSFTEDRPTQDLQFSADSTTWSCTALVSTQRQFAVIVDGRETGLWPNRPRVKFAPSGSDFFYTVQSNNSEVIVHREKVIGSFKSVSDAVFSGDGQVFAFLADKAGGEPVFVLNDVEQSIEHRGFKLQLSHDGKTRAWVEANKLRRRLNFNGKAGKWFDDVSGVTISADGQRVAHLAKTGKKNHVIADDLSWEDHGIPRDLLWSRDGTRLACIVHSRGGKGKSSAEQVILNNKPEKSFTEIESMEFSPDGSRLAYIARNQEHRLLIVDSVEQELPAARLYRLSFSPNGQHIAVVAKVSETSAFCMVDGKPQRAFEKVEDVSWSGDGQHIGYIGRDSPGGKPSDRPGLRTERVSVMIDGKVARLYDSLLNVGRHGLWSNHEGELCWTGMRGTNVLAGRFK
jgi:hypothetical protein